MKQIAKKTIIDKIKKIQQLREQWEAILDGDDEEAKEELLDIYERSGSEVRAPLMTTELATAMTELATYTRRPNSHWSAECRKIILRIDEFADVLHDWISKRFMAQDITQHPNGGESLWRMWDYVREQATEPKHMLEPIKALITMKVSEEQIAKMYEFVDEDGNTRKDLFAKELEEPGSVSSRPEFNPVVRGEVRETARAWEERNDRDDLAEKPEAIDVDFDSVERFDDSGIDESSWNKNPEAPETLEELISDASDKNGQGIPIWQIAALKANWIDDQMVTGPQWEPVTGSLEGDREKFVREYAIEHSIPHPTDPEIRQGIEQKNARLREQLQIGESGAPAQPPIASIDTFKDYGFTTEERIRAMREQNIGPMTIVAALRLNGCEIQVDEAKRICDEYDVELAKAAGAKIEKITPSEPQIRGGHNKKGRTAKK